MKHRFGKIPTTPRERIFSYLFLVWMVFFFVLHTANTWQLTENSFIPAYLIALALSSLLGLVILIAYRLFIVLHGNSDVSIGIPALSIAIIVIVMTVFNIDRIVSMDPTGLSAIPGFALDFLKSVSVVTLFLLSAYLVGDALLEYFMPRVFGKGEGGPISVAIGVGVSGYFILLIDLFGIAYPLTVFLSAIAIITLFRKRAKELLNSFMTKKLIIKPGLRTENVIAVILIMLTFLSFFLSYAGLAVGGWDTFHQYLVFPETYAKYHTLVPFPFHPHWGFPQLSEMIFEEGLLLGDTRTPFLLNFAFITLGFIGFAVTAKKIAGKSFVWPLAAFASVPLLLRFWSGYLKVESILFLFVAALFMLLWKIARRKESSDGKFGPWVLVAIMLGLMLSVKYTSFFIGAALAASLILFHRSFDFDWKKAVLVAGISMIFLSPWLIKDQLYYGNPLYPALQGNDPVSEKLGTNCQASFIQICNEDNFVNRRPEMFQKDSVHLSSAFLTTRPFIMGDGSDITSTGPFFMLFLPLLWWLLFRTKDPFLRFLISFSAIFLALGVYFFTGQTWYLLPMMFPFMLALAYAWKESEGTIINAMSRSLIFLWIFFLLTVNIFSSGTVELAKYARSGSGLGYALQEIGKICGDQRRRDAYLAWQDVNDLISKRDGESTVVYGFMDPQGYFIKDSFRHFIPDFFGYLYTCISKNGDIGDGLKKLGVTHVLFDAAAPSGCLQNDVFLTCRAYFGFRDFISTHGTLVKKEGSFELYSIE
ncbi:MAG: hypothetical protein WCL23_00760 [Candidatus Moraniibacteriota bacterium]